MTERDPLWLQAGNYTATEDRLGLAAIFGSRHFVDLAPSASPLLSAGGGHGVVGSGDMAVTGDGAGMDVTVAAGLALVRGTQQGDQGVYVTSNDAPLTLTVSAADATNPRKDLVVTRVKDNEFGIAGDTGPLEVIAGTPTGGLTAGNATGRPTPPENALVLAEVFIPAAVTSNASFTITDLRTRATAVGGTFVCASSATYPNPATEGMVVIDLALDQKLIYSGSVWVSVGGYGAWSTYTPTLGGITLGNGTVTGRYMRVGRMVTVSIRFVKQSTTTFSGAFTVSLPVANNASTESAIPLKSYDSDQAKNYFGAAVVAASSSTASLYGLDPYTSTHPFTWVTPDTWHVYGSYEAAS